MLKMSKLIFRIIVSYLYFSHYFGLKVLHWLLNIFKRKKTHESYYQLYSLIHWPFVDTKKNQISNINMGEKSLSKECLVRCIFLYIDNCFLYSKNISLLTLLPAIFIIFPSFLCFHIQYTRIRCGSCPPFCKKQKNQKKKRLLAPMNFFCLQCEGEDFFNWFNFFKINLKQISS